MTNPVTFGITFILKTNKAKNGTAPLYARITLNGKRIELSLQRRITLKLWDERKSRLRGSSAESIQVNNSIDRIYNHIYEAFRQLQNEHKVLSASAIKSRYLGMDDVSIKFSQLFDYHTKNMSEILRPGTMKNYRTTEKYIFKFLDYKKNLQDIYLKELDYKFITEFEYYLRTNKNESHGRQLSNNGIMKHLERLKKLSNLACRLEWLDKNPFSNFSLKFKKVERKQLNRQELDALIRFKSKRISLLQTRDIFIFACFTGLSYIDVKNLTKDSIVIGIDGGYWVSTSREKSGQSVRVPMFSEAKEVV